VTYEQQCRRLLIAYPTDFRSERGEDLVATLVDDAADDARRLPLRTASNLITTGIRMRAAHAGATRGVRGPLSGGIEVAAVAGLGLQAAFAAACATYMVEHGVVFFLTLDDRAASVGATHAGTWIVVAILAAAAFVAAVRGQLRLAAVASVIATGYSLLVAGVVLHAVKAQHLGIINGRRAVPIGPNGFPTMGGFIVNSPRFPADSLAVRYGDYVATPGLLVIAILATGLTIFVAARRRQKPAPSRTWWWLAAAAPLATIFALVGDGSGASGTVKNLSYAIPPQGGILTAFQYLWGAAVFIGLLWALIDPRAGWVVALLSVPFVVYQLSTITIGAGYYGELGQPWWQTNLPLIAGGTAILLLSLLSIFTTRKFRRL
jgi:hypothetical protein